MYKIGMKVIASVHCSWLNEELEYSVEVLEIFSEGTFIETKREVYVNNERVGILTHKNCPELIRQPFIADENYYYVKLGSRTDAPRSENELELAKMLSEVIASSDMSGLTTGVGCESNVMILELVPESKIVTNNGF